MPVRREDNIELFRLVGPRDFAEPLALRAAVGRGRPAQERDHLGEVDLWKNFERGCVEVGLDSAGEG